MKAHGLAWCLLAVAGIFESASGVDSLIIPCDYGDGVEVTVPIVAVNDSDLSAVEFRFSYPDSLLAYVGWDTMGARIGGCEFSYLIPTGHNGIVIAYLHASYDGSRAIPSGRGKLMNISFCRRDFIADTLYTIRWEWAKFYPSPFDHENYHSPIFVDCRPNPPPESLRVVTAGGDSVRLEWREPVQPMTPVIAYEIWRNSDGGHPQFGVRLDSLEAPALGYCDRGVALDDSAYHYAVRACYGSRFSTFGEPVTVDFIPPVIDELSISDLGSSCRVECVAWDDGAGLDTFDVKLLYQDFPFYGAWIDTTMFFHGGLRRFLGSIPGDSARCVRFYAEACDGASPPNCVTEPPDDDGDGWPDSFYYCPSGCDTQASIQDWEIAKDLPESFALAQNYPNPFNSITEIRYDLAHSGWVKLEIFDILGRRVALLIHKHQEPGAWKVRWNGKDDGGQDASSGIYIIQLKAGEMSATRKAVLLR